MIRDDFEVVAKLARIIQKVLGPKEKPRRHFALTAKAITFFGAHLVRHYYNSKRILKEAALQN